MPGRFKDYIALPEAQHVPVAAHDGHRAGPRAHRDPDPHPRDAPRRRARHRGALEVQGARGGGHRRAGRAAVLVAAAAARVAEGAQGPGRVPRGGEGRPLPGRGLRLHAQGRRARLPARSDADRLRLPDPHAARRPRHRRAHQRQDRAAALQAAQRRRRRGADEPAPAPEQGLARLRRARRARASKIRNYLRQEQRDKSRRLGEELFEKELHKAGISASKLLKNDGGDAARLRVELKVQNLEELLRRHRVRQDRPRARS